MSFIFANNLKSEYFSTLTLNKQFFLDSPMVLDSTIEEIEEPTPLDRESIITTVPEYATEIYSYLRDAEVKKMSKIFYSVLK